MSPAAKDVGIESPNTIRMRLARDIARVYSSHPSVIGIGCCGSVARESADDESDIDLYVFWERPEPQWLEQPQLLGIDGDRFHFTGVDDNGEALEQYYCAGIKVDLAHELPASQEIVFGAVLDRLEISPELFKNMAAVSELVALYGGGVVDGLKSRARDFPQSLRQKALAEFVQFRPVSLLELCLHRRDSLGFYSYLVEAASHAIAVVAVLNGHYFHPAAELKGALDLLRRCKTQPPLLATTLDELLNSPSRTSVRQFRSDLLELLELVHQQSPEVSTSRAKRMINFKLRGKR